jgi:small subunit ribosomal protein S9
MEEEKKTTKKRTTKKPAAEVKKTVAAKPKVVRKKKIAVPPAEAAVQVAAVPTVAKEMIETPDRRPAATSVGAAQATEETAGQTALVAAETASAAVFSEPQKEMAPHKEATPHVKEAALHSVAKPKAAKKVVRPPEKSYGGTGRRKRAVARVFLKPGSGRFVVNGRGLNEITAGRVVLEVLAKRPLVVTETASSYDVFAKISGGGVAAQVGALSQGIARSLLQLNLGYRKVLKQEGLLTRDPREKERKKYGRKKARKRFQYSKR